MSGYLKIFNIISKHMGEKEQEKAMFPREALTKPPNPGANPTERLGNYAK